MTSSARRWRGSWPRCRASTRFAGTRLRCRRRRADDSAAGRRGWTARRCWASRSGCCSPICSNCAAARIATTAAGKRNTTLIELWNAYWPVILVGLLVGLVVGYLVFRPRQRVTPVERHAGPAAHGGRRFARAARKARDIADEAAHATSDVAGEILGTKVSAHLPGRWRARQSAGAQGRRSQARRAAECARGSPASTRSPACPRARSRRSTRDLGAFRGRLTRDRIVEQAHYLARGDLDGYSQKFGAL